MACIPVLVCAIFGSLASYCLSDTLKDVQEDVINSCMDHSSETDGISTCAQHSERSLLQKSAMMAGQETALAKTTMLEASSVSSSAGETPELPCLCATDDCDFDTEVPDQKIKCDIEHNSRKMFCKWIRKSAHVLEIGARYGQTSCHLSNMLAGQGRVTSVEADPDVWDVLEKNLQRRGCKVALIKGVVGPADKELTNIGNSGNLGYGSFSSLLQVPSPHHTLDSLNMAVDTLAIDCEGCFASFLEDNKGLEETLEMIVAEIHNEKEQQVVDNLVSKGWTLKDNVSRQRVLCRPGGSCEQADLTC